MAAQSRSLSENAGNGSFLGGGSVRDIHSTTALRDPSSLQQQTRDSGEGHVTVRVHQSQSEEGKRSKKKIEEARMLEDSFGRFHDYLRISLTEKCNLRCKYCMPEEGVSLSPKDTMLTTPEIVRIAGLFVAQGVTKIRLTGGEPTVRPDIVPLVSQISELRRQGLQSIGITTNGLTLSKQLPALIHAGLDGINMSLDTLVPQKFLFITRRNGFKMAQASLDAALAAKDDPSSPLKTLKINCVVMRGQNEDELADFVALTEHSSLDVRFIEYMPFDGNQWRDSKFMAYDEMLTVIRRRFPHIQRTHHADKPNDTSKAWRVPGFKGTVGFITSMSKHFCGTCNRLRLTADGSIKVCLFGSEEVSLRDMLRGGASDEELAGLTHRAVWGKHYAHGGKGGMHGIAASPDRPMIKIGG
eukprot:CAMPEP_0181331940 /NCGR_PEP_ID=MMETSP1101-20121128/24803_1 /TAXON_ID=46948 /ORGANISM="Rhodomonas abbreviata, Strain Caron Lab Isolate" /LENGTH=412 /DNA_ID=CAMNT_0023441501 /DNA_START=195 /DNA_END=1433 /DNA_ORIENTATION=-